MKRLKWKNESMQEIIAEQKGTIEIGAFSYCEFELEFLFGAFFYDVNLKNKDLLNYIINTIKGGHISQYKKELCMGRYKMNLECNELDIKHEDDLEKGNKAELKAKRIKAALEKKAKREKETISLDTKKIFN